jgi:hypothetical protein
VVPPAFTPFRLRHLPPFFTKMGEGRDGGLGLRANGRTRLFYGVLASARATVPVRDAGAEVSSVHLLPRTKRQLSEKWIAEISPGLFLVGRIIRQGRRVSRKMGIKNGGDRTSQLPFYGEFIHSSGCISLEIL